MSKELTLLEVSKQLKVFVLEFVKNGLDRRIIHGSFDIIETALKDYEQAKVHELKVRDFDKKLKALEIINKKEVNVALLKNPCISLKEYNLIIKDQIGKPFRLTQEEYELLKEILK